GTNFVSGASVKFGNVPALSVAVLSSTHIQAVVPNAPGTTPVNVTVGVSGLYSATDPPYDWFTISSAPPRPIVLSVVPNNALPNTTSSVIGYGFSPSQVVTYGNNLALSTSVVNSTYFTARVPWGVGGPTDMLVTSQGQTSLPRVSDRFTFA